jgi:hypothetical protein
MWRLPFKVPGNRFSGIENYQTVIKNIASNPNGCPIITFAIVIKFTIRLIVLLTYLGANSNAAFAQNTPPHYYHIPTTNVGTSNTYFLAPTSVFIFTQSELAGMIEPVNGPLEISTIWLRHGGETPISSVILDNFTIRMGHSSLVDAVPNFEDNFNLDAPQVVLSQTSYTYTPLVSNVDNPADGWTPINLDVPFTYNFTDNLCIEFSFDNYTGIVAGNYAPIDSWSATGSPVAQTSFTAGETMAEFAGPRPMFGLGTNCPSETIDMYVESCGTYTDEAGTEYATGGIYTYSTTNDAGCEVNVQLELNILAAPAVNISSESIGCGLQTEFMITATGNGPFTFTIPSENITNTTGIVTLAAGTFEAIIIDNNGCATNTLIDNSGANFCPEDFNQDLVIGVADLLEFNVAYGCTGDCCPYDLNSDGAVTVSDLLVFIAAFGEMCD